MRNRIDDTNLMTLKTSAVYQIITAYTTGLKHADHVELGGKSRSSVVLKSCPDSLRKGLPSSEPKYHRATGDLMKTYPVAMYFIR